MKSKITYKMIQEYVEKKYEFKVHTAYIVEIKRSLGLTMYDALGLWERLHNPDFKPLEFEGFKKQAEANAFTMSPKKWI